MRDELACGLYSAFKHAEKNSAQADALRRELCNLAHEHVSETPLQATAFWGCDAAFKAGISQGQLRLDALYAAVRLIPGLPRNEDARQLVLPLVDIVLQPVVSALAPDKPTLDAAWAAIWGAYRAHFGQM